MRLNKKRQLAEEEKQPGRESKTIRRDHAEEGQNASISSSSNKQLRHEDTQQEDETPNTLSRPSDQYDQ